ncbi:MAG TPA: response regulator transcription factor [Actinocrinis sp.]|nr:response regulator transcription factor [Actinocrinis sp.]
MSSVYLPSCAGDRSEHADGPAPSPPDQDPDTDPVTAPDPDAVPAAHAATTGTDLRVLITAGTELMRSGLQSMLAKLPEVAETGECADPAVALASVERGEVDILVVSPPMPDAAFHSLAECVARSRTKLLVVLRDFDLPPAEVVTQAVALPADGYLLESQLTAASLADAVLRMLQGEVPVPTVLARGLFSRLRSVEAEPAHRRFLLTPRELQVLSLLVDGLSNKQIARQLGVSEHGIKRHVGGVLAKLNCPNRTLAVALVLQKGLLCAP